MSVSVVYETHSTSIDNENGVATGWNEGALSEAGKEQARRLGERRRGDGLAAVFSSDLRRAVQTAEIAFAGSGLQIHYDRRLRECNYGALNGKPRAEVHVGGRHHLDEPFPDGESWRQAVGRVSGFLDEIAHSYERQRVLIIGHVATRWALDHTVVGIPLEQLIEAPLEWREGWEYELRQGL